MGFDEFVDLVVRVLGVTRKPNPEQHACLAHAPDTPLLIVAGPGSGKTSVLVLRALRHVMVDRIAPEEIMITTFTRKAAKEIRTRLIEWGAPLLDTAIGEASGDYAEFLGSIDINRFITGTLDSICEEMLSASRAPGERSPVVIEAFAANNLLARRGKIFEVASRIGQPFDNYLALYTNSDSAPRTLGDKTRVIRTIIDRLVQDEVDLTAYEGAGDHQVARRGVGEIYRNYLEHLSSTHQMDFPALEKAFLSKLGGRALPNPVGSLRAILVDEYQDTNPLQERIYLELAKTTGSSLTAVGDDDQSLYRFRGATIELFRDFRSRVARHLACEPPRMLYLTTNYRSTPEIVEFFNRFIVNDPDFIPARIQPPKPQIRPDRPSLNMPVLGMFRPDAEQLAADLSGFLDQVFRQGGRPADKLLGETIRAAPVGGDLGDAVLISHTVNEFSAAFGTQPAKPRFPWLLRQQLLHRNISCFNPRGRGLKDIPEVGRALGLVLECLDTAGGAGGLGPIANDMNMTRAAKDVLRRWQQEAQQFLATDPPAVVDHGSSLSEVVNRWRGFAQQGGGSAAEWPLLDVLYNLIPWMPGFRDDPEHQVYLEAISRAASQAATFSTYRSLIIRDDSHRVRSIQAIIRDVLAPIADDLVDVDEDIMPSVPRNRLNLMTIHQAKGLEFPLVIVDIASNFKTDHPKQRFRRFPDTPSPVTLLEDDLATATPIGALRVERTAIQRSFEDLIRLYYVAYSRPQTVLMLVGCSRCLEYAKPIQHVASFWPREGNWSWRQEPVQRKGHPPVADAIPITLI